MNGFYKCVTCREIKSRKEFGNHYLEYGVYGGKIEKERNLKCIDCNSLPEYKPSFSSPQIPYKLKIKMTKEKKEKELNFLKSKINERKKTLENSLR